MHLRAMLPEVSEMLEAISNTCPILYLHEISNLFTLNIFEQLYIPRLVADELGCYDLNAEDIALSSPISIVPINREQRDNYFTFSDCPIILSLSKE